MTIFSYAPDAVVEVPLGQHDSPPCVECTTERSFDAALRLHQHRPLILNFASARNPGGGYAIGVPGQEEDLCRRLALVDQLRSEEAAPFYAHHRLEDPLNTDWILYISGVPIRRDFATTVDVISCAAPHARDARFYGVTDEVIERTFRARVRRVLAVAAAHAHDCLVLGAWGCGHFGNDPEMVASAFAEGLHSDLFAGNFLRVIFAIHSTGPEDIGQAFRAHFA